ncbi:alpha-amylase family protein [Nocardioides pacificus]
MRLAETSDLWWKTAVVYCLDVQTFMDWDDDGNGDLVGLTERVDYLAELGVTCLWLMPFYPTTDRDDGYDITDYYGVDPRLGTHGDLVEAIRTAKDRGMRVIVDLVVNHTSDQHPWFLSARASKDSPYRDFYVWRSDPPPDTSDQVVFPDQEDSIWEYDETTGEWYLHHFYAHQPDLNVSNEAVRDEIAKMMGFWLQLGVSGFRVDAVPFLIDNDGGQGADGAGGPGGKDDGELPDPHDYLRALRAFLSRRAGEAILLGEVNLPHKEQVAFFGEGDGDQLTMMFDFVVMQQLYLSLARGDARPLAQALAARPPLPVHSQWGTFLRNHDELTLDQLTDDERQEVFAAFGPEKSMQLFDRGLRRRLPPMLDGDPDRLRLAYSLLFSLPGTPVLFYGEEIGMGENLDIPGRLAVRSPMQWSDEANAGFSRAPADQLPRPVTAGRFGPEHVNVAAQRKDPDSLLNFLRLMIHTYRQSPELGWADLEILDQPCPAVLAHECRWGDRRLVAVHNLGAQPQQVPLQLADCEGLQLVDVLGEDDADLDGDRTTVALPAYGYRWLRLTPPDGKRLV